MCRVLLQCVSYEEEDTCDNVSCVVAKPRPNSMYMCMRFLYFYSFFKKR